MYLGPKCRPRETVENAIAVKEPPPRNLPFPQTFSVVTLPGQWCWGFQILLLHLYFYFSLEAKSISFKWVAMRYYGSPIPVQKFISPYLWNQRRVSFCSNISLHFMLKIFKILWPFLGKNKQINKKNKSWHHHHCVWLSKPLPCGKTNEHWF